jgi:SMI1 / KNR4 family (SUKH-1)
MVLMMSFPDLDWREPGEPVDPEEVRAVGKVLGIEYPDDYVDYVSQNSGSWSARIGGFTVKNTEMGEIGDGIGFLLVPALGGDYSVGEIIRAVEFWEPSLIPFSESGGGTYVAFRLRDKLPPDIVYFDPHLGPPEECTFFLANTFSEFLTLLYDVDEEDRRLGLIP